MSDNQEIAWNDVFSVFGASVGAAGVAAVNFVLTAAWVNALPATNGLAVTVAATHAGVGLAAASHGLLIIAASMALPLAAAPFIPYLLYRRKRARK